MGLRKTYLDAGPGIVTSGGRQIRRYTVGEEFNLVEYEETTINESRVWVGLTLDAAKGQADKNEQPTNEDGTAEEKAIYSWSYREDQRVVGSYILQRDYEKKITVPVQFAAAPVLDEAPTFTPEGQENIKNASDGSAPFDVTINTSNPSATLFYRVRVAQRSGWNTSSTIRSESDGGTVFGATFPSIAYTQASSGTQVISVNPSDSVKENWIKTKAGVAGTDYGIWRKVVLVEAYEEIIVTNTANGEPVTYKSPTRKRYFMTDGLQVLRFDNPTVTPAGGSSSSNAATVSFPVTVTVTCPNTNLQAETRAFYWNGSQWLTQERILASSHQTTRTLDPPSYSYVSRIFPFPLLSAKLADLQVISVLFNSVGRFSNPSFTPKFYK